MSGETKTLEALARAYDREDASQRGEPDPWDDGAEDPIWRAERLACAKAAMQAISTPIAAGGGEATASAVFDAIRPYVRDFVDFDLVRHVLREALSTPASGGLAVKALRDAMRQAMDIYQADAESDIGEAMFMVLHTALSSLDRTTLPTAEGWQTMDSAPKDGTAIIGSNDDETAYICAWVADDAEGNGDWLAYGSDVVNPRRWIPVPSGKVMIRAFVAPSNGAQ
ncbi:hypothetical protein EFV37_29340 [Mesorhizobium loti]|uniref:Uncharacterized protein n=1 Tax=Mesorhizobium jarvisii TaxID=1777867 RepID=A0A6M7TPA3_9HYPH|nr:MULTISPECIES: hypothetical protein [Mesorhizobium]OBQ68944.1 hypothetical protein A9K72_12195 [Mesorhizobium loti]QKC65908.1 hypothetical protein EB229_29330 [Mesorhizobium jarvisii]QKD11822.1 hypothetical protein EFV37_29340 [Mesorhizobium loti]RJT37929.1 hypothetical protein D3242_01385 [Mesorhizobium jarvisii]